MRLEELEAQHFRGSSAYSAEVASTDGDASHRLEVLGDNGLLQQAFGESDFEITITPKGSEKEWATHFRKLMGTPKAPPAEVESLSFRDHFKESPPPPEGDFATTAIVSLESLRPEGTMYGLSVALFVPAGASFFFVLPPVCTCGGVLMPASGDPDLFLSLNGATTPVVASSVMGGTRWDRVSFARACWPWTHFVPVFRVFGFTASACAFSWGGWGLP